MSYYFITSERLIDPTSIAIVAFWFLYWIYESRVGNHYNELISTILNPLRGSIHDFVAFPHTSYGVI
jgi:hypothetical protein